MGVILDVVTQQQDTSSKGQKLRAVPREFLSFRRDIRETPLFPMQLSYYTCFRRLSNCLKVFVHSGNEMRPVLNGLLSIFSRQVPKPYHSL